jgi:hypothetical protein
MSHKVEPEWIRHRPSLKGKSGAHALRPDPGVYVVLAMVDMPKIKKSDALGLLYVGQASRLSDRLNFGRRTDAFRKKYGISADQSRSVNSFDHNCLTFCLDFDDAAHELKFDSSLTGSGSLLAHAKPVVLVRYDDDPKGLESDLLLEHFDKFGCMPPFNSTGMSFKSYFRRGRSVTNHLESLDRFVRVA